MRQAGGGASARRQEMGEAPQPQRLCRAEVPGVPSQGSGVGGGIGDGARALWRTRLLGRRRTHSLPGGGRVLPCRHAPPRADAGARGGERGGGVGGGAASTLRRSPESCP
ncbi:hypothetical protein BRADI_4g04848v3 [Brachypodium distachyon]|uniref:Uncharacterized protein n=1 Tax=Brachypodium distachyon TaxID=15368 RepID=A0A2K2CKH2_BRADI|nr:hypothetical protein BRADI_4g04848v3 [Brachypodium distachyon]